MTVDWHDLHHRELSVSQLYALLALRCAVFIVEQRCAYQDIDGQDLRPENRHILATDDARLLACARILAPTDADAAVKIGRVVVAPEARGQRLGERLMQQALYSCQRYWPGHAILLSAQAHLQSFYAGLGFQPEGEVYLEDGISHIDMRRSG